MRNAGLLVIAATLFAASPSSASGKMDLRLKMLVGSPQIGKAMLGKAVSVEGGRERVDVIIKSADPHTTAAAIEAAGGEVRTTIGDIMTAFVPVESLSALEAQGEVRGLEASKPLRPLMDSARANTGADRIQSGAAEGAAYDGTNVVVGAIDTGLDYTRADFQTAAGSSRVQYLRFQSISNGTISATTCTKSQINDGTCTIAADNDSVQGHGSHVMGIAAGGGGGTNYIGMAPAADIMLVRNAFTDFLVDTGNDGSATFSSSLLDGVSAIFEKAGEIDKAAVINISQGTHVGAHDNSSLLEQGLNSAAAAAAGRAIIVAAGNENIVYAALAGSAVLPFAGGIHAPVMVPDGSAYGYRLWLLVAPQEPIEVDAWFGSGQAASCNVTARAYNSVVKSFAGTLTTADAQATVGELPLSTDNSGTSASTADNKVTVSAAIDASDSQNSKPHALFIIGLGTAGSWDDIVLVPPATGYLFDIIVRAAGGACSGDLWIEGGGANATYVNFLKGIDTGAFDVGGSGSYVMKIGDNSSTVDIPGTASGVITAGAYLQEKPAASGGSSWTDSAGTTHDATVFNADSESSGTSNEGLGGRTPFSSIGPTNSTAAGTQKPDLLAPGDPMISVLPTGYAPEASLQVDATHYKSQGTSQAAPAVAGIVALLLQKNSCLTSAEVKSALMNTAIATQSGYDAAMDGAGKIDAVAAMAAVTAPATQCHTGTGDVPDDGGGGGSGGCFGTIAPVASAPAAAGVALLLMLPGALIALCRRRYRR